jgi:hypothetical protein
MAGWVMADGPKRSNTPRKRQDVADEAARRLEGHCPKCGSDNVQPITPFNPVHADGVYCHQCGRHSFPDEVHL